MKKTTLEVAHEIASDLYKSGAIDAKTMHEFDARMLTCCQKNIHQNKLNAFAYEIK